MKKLHLGCNNKVLRGYDNHDRLPFEGIKYNFNLENPPYPIENNTYDEIYSHHVFEHVFNFERLVLECHRILKPNGKLIIQVPYVRGSGALAAAGHVKFFDENTFSYFTENMDHIDVERKDPYFILEKIEMIFGRIPPLQWFLWKTMIFWCGGDIKYTLKKV